MFDLHKGCTTEQLNVLLGQNPLWSVKYSSCVFKFSDYKHVGQKATCVKKLILCIGPCSLNSAYRPYRLCCKEKLITISLFFVTVYESF